MKKVIKKIIVICALFVCFNMSEVVALENNYNTLDNYLVVEKVSVKRFDDTLYDNVVSAEVNCSSLGLLRKDLDGIFNVFKIIAPILTVVFSVYDFIKAFTGKVEGDMKKAFTKLVKRLVFSVILFFLPDLLDFFLGLVDSGYSTCINS